MPDFGFWELALVMLVALLIVGPQKLPRLAAEAGGWIGRIKKMAMRFKADLAYELNASELEETIGKPQKEIEQVKKELQETGRQAGDAVRALDPMHDTIRKQISSGRYSGEDESLVQASMEHQVPSGKKTQASANRDPDDTG